MIQKSIMGLSFCIALFAGALPWLVPDKFLIITFLATALCWLVLALVILLIYRKRGLWILAGLPVTFWWFGALFWECGIRGDCL